MKNSHCAPLTPAASHCPPPPLWVCARQWARMKGPGIFQGAKGRGCYVWQSRSQEGQCGCWNLLVARRLGVPLENVKANQSALEGAVCRGALCEDNQSPWHETSPPTCWPLPLAPDAGVWVLPHWLLKTATLSLFFTDKRDEIICFWLHSEEMAMPGFATRLSDLRTQGQTPREPWHQAASGGRESQWAHLASGLASSNWLKNAQHRHLQFKHSVPWARRIRLKLGGWIIDGNFRYLLSYAKPVMEILYQVLYQENVRVNLRGAFGEDKEGCIVPGAET